jgi:hypothetical protein
MVVVQPVTTNSSPSVPSAVQAVLNSYVAVCSEVQPVWLQEVLNSYVTDVEAQRRLTELALASPDEHGYELRKGIIRLRGRVWIGSNSTLQTKLITAFHSSAVGGHSGVDATYQRIKRLFVWTGLKSPFQALYGHEPNFGAMPELEPENSSPVSGVLAERATQLAILKRNLEAAQARMKINANKLRIEGEF